MGADWKRMATQAWLGMERLGGDRQGRLVVARRGLARRGTERQRRQGAAWLHAVRIGLARQAWQVVAGFGAARNGDTTQAANRWRRCNDRTVLRIVAT